MKILFVCMSNSRRSVMAEAIYNKICGRSAISAGIDPKEEIDKNVLVVLRELKAKPRNNTPVKITEKMMEEADKIITFRCDEYIPYKFKLKVENWELGRKRGIGEPQSERSLEEIRNMRDEILEKIKYISSRPDV